jgi:polyisoprenoid-binding protein YceI
MQVSSMKRHRLLSTTVFLACIFGGGAASWAGLSSPADTHVTFVASGPAGMKIEGTTTELNVADANGSVVITVPLGNLTTGISLRDRHMKEKYLEVSKYPSAVLTVARTALKLPDTGGKAEADVAGTLALHGQTRPVSVHYQAKADGSAFLANGKVHINMNDFGISVPVYLGVTVKPDVDVVASFRVSGT